MLISSKEISWILDKATPIITLSSQSISLDTSKLADTVTIEREGNGEITIISSDDNIATVSISEDILTINAIGNGSCTITVTVAESNNYLETSTTIPVTSALLPEQGLSSYTPAQIKTIVNAGKHTTYFSVGDTFPITLNGTVGIVTFSNNTYYATILGFDHNKVTETGGKSSIHFIIGKDSQGRDITFCDNRYWDGSSGTAAFRMNLSDTNSGGWKNSYMRNTICSQFLNSMPSEWNNVLGNISKYTDNTGGNADQASYVTATDDKIFILSVYELYKKTREINPGEPTYQQQYTYYANGNSKARQGHNGRSNPRWWLRSPSAFGRPDAFRSTMGGNSDNDGTCNSASHPLGFTPCFVIVAD